MPEPSAPTRRLAHPLLEGEDRTPPFTAMPAEVLSRALIGMVARGHGIDFLCLCLGLAHTALLDMIVELGLPTPHNRPFRQPCGRNPWSFSDTALFIILWMDGWRAQSLALQFGRSRGSVWAKARHLGLPRRHRKHLLSPTPISLALARPALVDHPVMCGASSNATVVVSPGEPIDPPSLVQASAADTAAVCAPLAAPVEAPTQPLPPLAPIQDDGDQGGLLNLLNPLPPEFDFRPTPAGSVSFPKSKRAEVEWVRPLDIELSRRWWARQHYRMIAEAMGISPVAVQSRRFRIGLPSLFDLEDLHIFRREELVEHFDPTVIDVHIAAAGYVERRCNQFARVGKSFWFWSKQANYQFTSDEWARNEKRQQKRQRDAMDCPLRPLSTLGLSLHLS